MTICRRLLLDLFSSLALLLLVLLVPPSTTDAFQSRVPARSIHGKNSDPQNQKCRRTSWAKLQCAATSTSEVREKLGLHDRFDRWRFLQNLLDEDIGADDTQLVLFALLHSYLKFPARPAYKEGSDETGSPDLTLERRQTIESLLQISSAQAIQELLQQQDDKEASAEQELPQTMVLEQLELLLPDPVEDEDAFKGLWDTVIELNGRESVKINERNATLQWKTRCLIARVLLHYDFLLYGLVDEPLC